VLGAGSYDHTSQFGKCSANLIANEPTCAPMSMIRGLATSKVAKSSHGYVSRQNTSSSGANESGLLAHTRLTPDRLRNVSSDCRNGVD